MFRPFHRPAVVLRKRLSVPKGMPDATVAVLSVYRDIEPLVRIGWPLDAVRQPGPTSVLACADSHLDGIRRGAPRAHRLPASLTRPAPSGDFANDRVDAECHVDVSGFWRILIIVRKPVHALLCTLAFADI